MQDLTDERIVLFGDSLGKGVIWNADRSRYGFAETSAASIVENRLHCAIDNRSKFGATSTMGLAMLKKDLTGVTACDAAIIEYGGNDCNFDWKGISEAPHAQHMPNTAPEHFYATLREMVALLLNAGVRPILMTLPPIDPERYFRFFIGEKLNAENVLDWLGDVWQIYRFQEMYSLLIADVAFAMQVRLLDLRAKCLAVSGFIRDYICEDGLHLNARGQIFAGEQLASLSSAIR